MKLHLWGTDFRRSTPEMRQKLYCHPDKREALLRELLSFGFEDLVYLHTCNRVEFYTTGKDYFSDSRPLWLKALGHLGLSEEDFYRGYHLEGKSALRHLLRVACSLESLVVGEPQILGQLKEALRVTKDSGLPLSGTLERDFNLAFETAKKVRTQTAISEKPVSVATLGLQHLQSMEREFPVEKAVVVGRGPISVLIVEWLAKNRPGCEITWINRTISALEQLPASRSAKLVPLSDFLAHPGDFTHLFTATSSVQPLFDRSFFARLQGGKKVIFDFAQPADVEKSEEACEKAVVLAMEDLAEEARGNAAARAQAIGQAESIIEEAIREYCIASKEAPVLREFSEVEPRFMQELASALGTIEREFPPELQPKLKKFAQKLVKKNLHSSREHLRSVLRNIAKPGGSMPVM